MAELSDQRASVKAMGLGSPRNGRPVRRNYVYRGSGKDSMPWAVLDDDPLEDAKVQHGRGLPEAERRARQRCRVCGYLRHSRSHRMSCLGTTW